MSVLRFYLAPHATPAQLDDSENTIWDAIQASPYLEPSRPMQIYYTQEKDAVILTAKAYVASTYDEPSFRSDVTRAFLRTVDAKRIPLASTRYRETTARATGDDEEE
jgi:hypothetical protein